MRIHHLALRTADVERLVAFYQKVFDLHETRRNGERSVWLDAGGVIVMIERAEPREASFPAKSMELVAFAIESKERERWREKLAANEIAVEAETSFTLYFRDPDGRRVAVSSY